MTCWWFFKNIPVTTYVLLKLSGQLYHEAEFLGAEARTPSTGGLNNLHQLHIKYRHQPRQVYVSWTAAPRLGVDARRRNC